MKRAINIKSVVTAFILVIFLPGCFKDTVKRTYTLYYPVYKSVAEARANIKSNNAVAVTTPGKLFLLGNYIFLNEVDKGIHVIDNSNPSAPVNKYFIDIPGNVDVAVKGNTLYADMYDDLITIDISDPGNIQVKAINENVFPYRRYASGFTADTTQIIVDWIKKDTVVHESAAATNWRLSGRFMAFSSREAQTASFAAAPTGISGSMARFTLLTNYLYTVTDMSLNVFDITQPQQPVFSNKVNIGWGIETIYPFKNNLFIGSRNGMYAYSTTNPLQPTRLGLFTHATSCDPVIADDDNAFVTLRSGNACVGFQNQLDVLNIKDITKPALIKTYSLTNPHGLSKDDKLLFICDGKDGLKVYDASDVNNLRLLTKRQGMETYDVIADNGVAIVVAKDGLYQFSYSKSGALQLLSKISI